jgi:hypothetical protein
MSASKAPPKAPKKSTGSVGLDPSDSIDRQIIARQVGAARQAGREGRDRAKVTRGRPHLETAYDEGATEGDGDDEGQEEEPEENRSSRGKDAWQKANRGSWKAFKPRSPARPVTRVGDAGGLLSGMLLYTAVVIYIRYGPAGWKGWLSAKFLNKPMTSAAASSAAGTGSAVKSV